MSQLRVTDFQVTRLLFVLTWLTMLKSPPYFEPGRFTIVTAFVLTAASAEVDGTE